MTGLATKVEIKKHATVNAITLILARTFGLAFSFCGGAYLGFAFVLKSPLNDAYHSIFGGSVNLSKAAASSFFLGIPVGGFIGSIIGSVILGIIIRRAFKIKEEEIYMAKSEKSTKELVKDIVKILIFGVLVGCIIFLLGYFRFYDL